MKRRSLIAGIGSICILLMLGMLPFQGAYAPVEAATPKRGGVLKIGIEYDAQVLGYPPKMHKITDGFYATTAIETLLRSTQKGPIPGLATSWKIGPDFKYIDLTLRNGVKFHDGTDFNAEACKWNLEQFKGAGRSELASVESIDTIDDYTVRLNLSQPDNMVISYLADWPGFMVSPTAFKKNGEEWCITHPVGTGPFKFLSWQRDVSMKFERFDGYWQKGKPYLDGVEWLKIADPMVRLASFKAGELDVIIGLAPKDAKDLKASGKYDISASYGGFIGLAFDARSPNSIFNDVRLRKAVAYAIDTKAIVEALGYGYREFINQVAAPTAWGYNPKIVSYPYNPEKAKALLTEAGYPKGFNTKIISPPSPDTIDQYSLVQAQLASVGINVEIEKIDWGRVDKLVVGGTWPSAMAWFVMDFALQDDLRTINLLSSKSPLWTQILHPDKINDIAVQAAKVSDFETKKALVQDAMKAIIDEYCTVLCLGINLNPIARYPKVNDDGLCEVSPWRHRLEDAWIE